MTTYTATAYIKVATDAYSDMKQSDGNNSGQPNSAFLPFGWIDISGVILTRTIGLSFPDFSIPVGATITSAYLYLYSTGGPTYTGGVKKGYLHGATGGGRKVFNFAEANRPSNATRTVAKSEILWGPTDRYGGADATAALQELVNQAAWTDSSSVAFVLTPEPRDFPYGEVEFASSQANWGNDAAVRLEVTYEYTPTLKPLTLSFGEVGSNRPAGYTAASLLNYTPESTLTPISNDSGGLIVFNSSAKTFTVGGSLADKVGLTYSITLEEALAGANGSPKYTTLTISVVQGGDAVPPELRSHIYGTGGDGNMSLPANLAGDLMLACGYAFNLSGIAPPNVSIAGWEKLTPTLTATYFGAYGVSYDVFYRLSNGAEPSSYPIAGAAGFSGFNVVSVAYPGNVKVAPRLTSVAEAAIQWDSLSAEGDSLVLLCGGNPLAQPESAPPTDWGTTVPAGTTRASGANPSPGWGLASFTHTGGLTPSKSAPTASGVVDSPAYTIAIEPDGPASLSLTLDKYSVHANAPVGYVSANILGKTAGSTLTLGAGMDPYLELVGSEVRVKFPITDAQDAALPVRVVETLAGAPNSPYTFSSTITVGPPRICEFVAALTGTTTPVLPAHQAGDMLVCFMFRDGNTTAPALPAGWTAWLTAPGSTCSYRLCYKIATSSAESGGTPSTATTCITSVYRPAAGWALAAGSSLSGSTGTTATVTYPTLSLHKTDGTSFIGGAGGHRSTNTAIDTPPAGMVLRHQALDATDEAAMFDTNGGVASWANQNVAIGGTASGRMTVVFEIKGTYTPPPTSDRKPPRHSHWL